MKKFTKLSAIIVSVILALSAFGFVGCAPAVKKPDPTPVVQSITLKYDNANVNQTLSVDVSRGTITLTASVIKDAGADGTVTYESSDASVATVANDGTVTLLKKGESVITAKAGDKSTSIVLVVGDEFNVSNPTTYSVTVVGGTADKLQAEAGEVVMLTPTIPDHKQFVEWQYSVDANDLVLNGNAFEMPDAAITVTAVYEAKLYTLNVVGATFESDDYQGADGGNIKDGSLAKYDMTTYQLPYDTPVTLEGVTPASGETFVAWDFGQQGNRVGELGNDSYTFNMPDETTTVWANYATLTNTIFTAGSVVGYTSTKTTLDGLSGYRIKSGSAGTSTGYSENIQGSTFTTVNSLKMVKAVFKNDGANDVTLEIYPSYHGNTTSSGAVTVPAGQTVTHCFSVETIVNNPWWGIRFNQLSNRNVDVTFGVGYTDLYPEGDPFALKKAEFVEVEGYKATANGRIDGPSGDDCQIWYSYDCNENAAPRFTSNAVGTTVMATRDSYIGSHSGCFTYSQITNMGAFDANNPTKTIYVQLTCASNTPNIEYEVLVTKNVTFNSKFTTAGTNADSDTVLTNVLARQKVSFTTTGQQIVVKLEVPRTASDTNYAFVIRPTVKNANYFYNVNLKMTYNDVFGYEDAQ